MSDRSAFFKVSFSASVCAAALGVSAAALLSVPVRAQQAPLISVSSAFFTNTTGGNTSFTPTLQPVLAVPVGNRLLFESRAYLLESFFPQGGGKGYDTSHFVAVTYAQADFLATDHITVVGGYFLTPFGTYNERLTPIWIFNFQDAPLITPLGTMTNGAGLGGQLRGSAYSSPKLNIDYAAYFSAHSSNEQFASARSSGGRLDFFLPQAHVEIGTSYGRLLEGQQQNTIGAHLWWTPSNIPLRVRSEYAHGAHAQGYWVETDYRLSHFGGPESKLGRLEPIFRMQQTFRNSPGQGDALPAQDTQRADFGLDYFLPHEVRIDTSYSRQFSAGQNVNIWETGIVYRLTLPAWRGK